MKPGISLFLAICLLFISTNFALAQMSYNGTITYTPPFGTEGPVARLNISIASSANPQNIDVRITVNSITVTGYATERRTWQKSELPASVTSLFNAGADYAIYYDVYNGNTQAVANKPDKSDLSYSEVLHENFDVGNQADQNSRGETLYKSGALNIRNVRLRFLNMIELGTAVHDFEAQQFNKSNNSNTAVVANIGNQTSANHIIIANSGQGSQTRSVTTDKAAVSQVLQQQQQQQAAAEARQKANDQLAQSVGEVADMVGQAIINASAERQDRFLKQLAEDENNKDKIKALMPLANQGNSEAMFQIGVLTYWLNYNRNNGKPDISSAYDGKEWYIKAAHAGSVNAMKELGNIFTSYYKIKQEALYWYEQAAQWGDKDAMQITATLYTKMKNKDKAELWTKRINGTEPLPHIISTNDSVKIAQQFFDDGIAAQANDHEMAYNNFVKAAAALPNNINAVKGAAIWAYRTERYQEAARYYERLLTLGDNEPESYKNLMAIYLNEGDNASALRICKAAKKNVPDQAKYWKQEEARLTNGYAQKWEEAITAAGKGDNETAYTNFTACYKLDPADTLLIKYLAATAYYTKRYDEAIGLFKEALNKGDNAFDIYTNTALAYFAKKDSVNAVATLQTAAGKYHDNKGMLSSTYGALGDLYYRYKDDKNSDSAYQQALDYYPDNAPVLNIYAWDISLRGRELDRAAQMAARANELQPNTAYMEDTYAWVFFRQKKYTDAKVWIERAITDDKTNRAIYKEHYGDIMFCFGDIDAAVENWKKARSIGGDDLSSLLDRKISERKFIE